MAVRWEEQRQCGSGGGNALMGPGQGSVGRVVGRISTISFIIIISYFVAADFIIIISRLLHKNSQHLLLVSQSWFTYGDST